MFIGLISDTHGVFDEQFREFLEPVDEIWHAGDIGNLEVADQLKAVRPLRAVYGNIDNSEIREEYPLNQIFEVEGVKVFLTHIGGYPGRYSARVKSILLEEKPKLYICGHSHILKVMHDKKLNVLHMNPGAAGNVGMHYVRTMLRFQLNQ